jgi:hypothetical protein
MPANGRRLCQKEAARALASEQESLFEQWPGEHKGLMFRVVWACAASPQDQDDPLWSIRPIGFDLALRGKIDLPGV